MGPHNDEKVETDLKYSKKGRGCFEIVKIKSHLVEKTWDLFSLKKNMAHTRNRTKAKPISPSSINVLQPFLKGGAFCVSSTKNKKKSCLASVFLPFFPFPFSFSFSFFFSALKKLSLKKTRSN